MPLPFVVTLWNETCRTCKDSNKKYLSQDIPIILTPTRFVAAIMPRISKNVVHKQLQLNFHVKKICVICKMTDSVLVLFCIILWGPRWFKNVIYILYLCQVSSTPILSTTSWHDVLGKLNCSCYHDIKTTFLTACTQK